MAHECHANFCNTPCRPEHLMCARHWRMVPMDVQERVYSYYVPGQCQDNPRPTREWLDSAYLAIAIVAETEGRGMNGFQRKQLNLYRGAPP